MIQVKEKVVPASFADTRLMDFASHSFDIFPSRTAAKKAIKRGEILLDGVASDPFTLLQTGQKVLLIDLELAPPGIYEFNLEILFEDEYLAIVYKPAGLPVSGNRHKTMVNALSFNLKAKACSPSRHPYTGIAGNCKNSNCADAAGKAIPGTKSQKTLSCYSCWKNTSKRNNR